MEGSGQEGLGQERCWTRGIHVRWKCRTGGMQERRDARKEGFKKGVMQERRDARKEGCKKGVMQEGAEGFVGFEPLKRTK